MTNPFDSSSGGASSGSGADPFGFDASSDPFASVQAGSTTTADPFGRVDVVNSFGGSGSPTSSGLIVAKPPLLWLWLALASAVIGGAVAVIVGQSWLAIAGWVLAGPIAIGLLGRFSSLDTCERVSGTYAAPAWVRPGLWGVTLLALAAVVLAAVNIGLWAGRL